MTSVYMTLFERLICMHACMGLELCIPVVILCNWTLLSGSVNPMRCIEDYCKHTRDEVELHKGPVQLHIVLLLYFVFSLSMAVHFLCSPS